MSKIRVDFQYKKDTIPWRSTFGGEDSLVNVLCDIALYDSAQES